MITATILASLAVIAAGFLIVVVRQWRKSEAP